MFYQVNVKGFNLLVLLPILQAINYMVDWLRGKNDDENYMKIYSEAINLVIWIVRHLFVFVIETTIKSNLYIQLWQTIAVGIPRSSYYCNWIYVCSWYLEQYIKHE